MWVAATLAAVMAVTACAAPTFTASPTPMGEEGLDQVQLRLLGLAYGRFVDFLKVLKVEEDFSSYLVQCAVKRGGNFYQTSYLLCTWF